MTCDNCIAEDELDPIKHTILDGPFSTQNECLNTNNPKAFFTIGYPTPTALSTNSTIDGLVIKLTDQNMIDSARRQISGLEPKKYVRGNIVNSFVWYNPSYSYHIDPSSISFLDIVALSESISDAVVMEEVQPAGEPQNKVWRCLNMTGCTEVDIDSDSQSFPHARDYWTKEDCENGCCKTTKNTYELEGFGCDPNCNTIEEICRREWCLRGWQADSPVGPDDVGIPGNPMSIPSSEWFCEHCPKDPFRELMIIPNPSITTPYDCICKEANNCDCLDLSETWGIDFQLGDGSKCNGAWCGTGMGSCNCYEGTYAEYAEGPNADDGDLSLYWAPFKRDLSCIGIASDSPVNNILECSCDGTIGDPGSQCHSCANLFDFGMHCLPNSFDRLMEVKCKYITRFKIRYSCDQGEGWKIVSSEHMTELSPPAEFDENSNPVYTWGLLFPSKITITNEWLIYAQYASDMGHAIEYVYYRIQNPPVPPEIFDEEIVFPLPPPPPPLPEICGTTTTTVQPTTTTTLPPSPRGACCEKECGQMWACHFETREWCDAIGGTYRGDGTTCADEWCADVPERCPEGGSCNDCGTYRSCDRCSTAYPVTCYRTGGASNSGGYGSVEVQCVDANGVRVFDGRSHNGGGFGGTWSFAGCGASDEGTISGPADAPLSICWGDHCISVGPDSFSNCASFGGGGNWCDNPIGTCG